MSALQSGPASRDSCGLFTITFLGFSRCFRPFLARLGIFDSEGADGLHFAVVIQLKIFLGSGLLPACPRCPARSHGLCTKFTRILKVLPVSCTDTSDFGCASAFSGCAAGASGAGFGGPGAWLVCPSVVPARNNVRANIIPARTFAPLSISPFSIKKDKFGPVCSCSRTDSHYLDVCSL